MYLDTKRNKFWSMPHLHALWYFDTSVTYPHPTPDFVESNVKFVVIPQRFVQQQYLWIFAIPPTVGCYNSWPYSRCSGCSPQGGNCCETSQCIKMYNICSAAVHDLSWWHHQMETFSVLLAICAGNSPVTGEFTGHRGIPARRPVTRSFEVFFDLRLNKCLSKQSGGWWFETPLRQYNVTVMIAETIPLCCERLVWYRI